MDSSLSMVSYVKNDVDKEELYVVSAASHHPGVLLGYILGVEIAFNFGLNSIKGNSNAAYTYNFIKSGIYCKAIKNLIPYLSRHYENKDLYIHYIYKTYKVSHKIEKRYSRIRKFR